MWDYFEDLDEYFCKRKTTCDEYNKFDDYIPNLKPTCLDGFIIKEALVQDRKGTAFFFSQRAIIEEKKEKITDKIIKTRKYIITKIRHR